jgi:hypothetical protein
MLKKYSKYTALLLAAGILLAGSQVSDATIIHERPYMSPRQAFWPVGNGIGSGKLKLYPEIGVGVIHDDNIFYEETGEESDLISHVIPRVRIDYSLQERGQFRIGYSGNFANYQDFSSNDWQRHHAALQLDYKAPSGIFLDVVDQFTDSEDPFGSEAEYGLGQKTSRWHNQFGLGLGYDYGDKFKIVGYFNHNKQAYDNITTDWGQNYDEPWYGVGIERRIGPKTWGFVRYFHGERDYNTQSPDTLVNETTDADYTADWVEAGLTWDATSRITGELNFGYEWRDYENSVNASGVPYEDGNNWLAETRINYSLKPDVTNLNLVFERAVYQRGGGTIEQYDGTYFTALLDHRFYSWFKLLLNFSIGRNEYNNGRDDDDIRSGIALEYLVRRRFTLSVGYDYTQRESSVPGESFTNNRFMGTLTVRY